MHHTCTIQCTIHAPYMHRTFISKNINEVSYLTVCMVHCTVHVWCMYGAFRRFCTVQIVCCVCMAIKIKNSYYNSNSKVIKSKKKEIETVQQASAQTFQKLSFFCLLRDHFAFCEAWGIFRKKSASFNSHFQQQHPV